MALPIAITPVKNISHKFKFIHIPKTGGETIDVLLNIKKNHKIALDRISEGNWKGTFKFAFVRNPWDRMVSWYFHLRKPLYKNDLIKSLHGNELKSGSLNYVKRGELLHPKEHCKLAMKLPFDQWVKSVLIGRKYRHWFFADQTKWILDKKGKPIVHHIGRFENYADDLTAIFQRIDRADLIPKIFRCNKSIHRNYREYYTPELAEIVRKRYFREVKYFGYVF